MPTVPALTTGQREIDQAFRIAIGDLWGNIQPWAGDRDDAPAPCILAGLDYDKPWTRDASFNSWFAGSLVAPDAARNTLLAVLTEDAHGLRIGGQYWDAILWVTAAWRHVLCTGDRAFLVTAFDAARNALRYFEATERDPADGLFRGAACFQDGIAGYPDRFIDGPTSGIFDWVRAHPDEKAPVGFGLPMKALSTNCLYCNAYRVLPRMAAALGVEADPAWAAAGDALAEAIRTHFWNDATGTFRYLLDADEDPARQEGFGHAFALLFGIADDAQARSVLDRQHLTAHGIPCVWPTYDRYTDAEGMSFGRHSGTIWPQVNAAWALAAAQAGRRDLAWGELRGLAEKACRDVHFYEIYHPVTGEAYGGLQESPHAGDGPLVWGSCRRQTWCATGYMRMVLTALFGLRIDADGLALAPDLPADIESATVEGLHYREATVTLTVERSGADAGVLLNGTPRPAAILPADATGPQHLVVRLP
ncbi:MAG: MGH1-like glycoside hydrolase domain-containing protein [Planctomycetota bacterium]